MQSHKRPNVIATTPTSHQLTPHLNHHQHQQAHQQQPPPNSALNGYHHSLTAPIPPPPPPPPPFSAMLNSPTMYAQAAAAAAAAAAAGNPHNMWTDPHTSPPVDVSQQAQYMWLLLYLQTTQRFLQSGVYR